MKKLTLIALTLSLALGSAYAQPTMGVVVKIGGIPWFNAMEMGIKEQAQKEGIDAFVIAPTSADPALQVRAIEDLIARKVDIIGVVPNDAQVLEPVLKKARDAGIKVITHESANSHNIDYDFEMVSNKALGEANAKLFAKETNCKGGYAIYVGGLSTPAHNEWADAAVAYLQRECPSFRQVSERFGVAEDVEASRTTTLDLIRAHSDLAGVLSFGSQGPIGVARAAISKGLGGKLKSVGLFSAGQGAALVHRGAIAGGYIWSPLEAGKAFVVLGKLLVEGKEIASFDELPVLGKIELKGKVIYSNQVLELSKQSVDALADLGL